MPKFAKKPVPTDDSHDGAPPSKGVTIGDYISGQLLDQPTPIDETEEPQLPGFAMSDEPLPPPDQPLPSQAQALNGEIMPPPKLHEPHQNGVKYESRISIVEAYQYPGNLSQAPDWIDKNWIGYADFDEFRKIEPGPCLRVPDATGAYIVCRPGDYVARQEVKFTHDLPGEIKIEVWEQQHFQKLFIPRLPEQPQD